jgi:hypothetical protein
MYWNIEKSSKNITSKTSGTPLKDKPMKREHRRRRHGKHIQ